MGLLATVGSGCPGAEPALHPWAEPQPGLAHWVARSSLGTWRSACLHWPPSGLCPESGSENLSPAASLQCPLLTTLGPQPLQSPGKGGGGRWCHAAELSCDPGPPRESACPVGCSAECPRGCGGRETAWLVGGWGTSGRLGHVQGPGLHEWLGRVAPGRGRLDPSSVPCAAPLCCHPTALCFGAPTPPHVTSHCHHPRHDPSGALGFDLPSRLCARPHALVSDLPGAALGLTRPPHPPCPAWV